MKKLLGKYWLASCAEEFTLERYLMIVGQHDSVGIVGALLGISRDEASQLPAMVLDLVLETTQSWLPKFLADTNAGKIPTMQAFMGCKLLSMAEMTLGHRMFWEDAMKSKDDKGRITSALACFVGQQLYGKDWMDNIDALKAEILNQPAMEALRAFFTAMQVRLTLKQLGKNWLYGLLARMKAR
jgi:hypothetical protein